MTGTVEAWDRLHTQRRHLLNYPNEDVVRFLDRPVDKDQMPLIQRVLSPCKPHRAAAILPNEPGDVLRAKPRYCELHGHQLERLEHVADAVVQARHQLCARGRQLEEFKSQRGIQTAEFGSRDMVYLLALRSLNRYIPTLSHFLEAPSAHPWEVYGLLRQLIGELSTFSETVNVMGEAGEDKLLPSYDHANLWPCFAAAQGLVSRLLDEITAGPEHVVPLVYDGTYYAAELPAAIFEARKRYYLVVRTELDPKQVIENLSVRDKAGFDRKVAEINKSEIVGEMAMFTGDKRTASIYAMRDSDLVRIRVNSTGVLQPWSTGATSPNGA